MPCHCPMKTRLMRSFTTADPSSLIRMVSWKSAIRQLWAERGTVSPKRQNRKSDKKMDRNAIDTSREAAQEYSPRRKPWVKSRPRLSPGGAEESFRIDNSWAAVFVGPCEPLFRPVGARAASALDPRLAPWAIFSRRFAAQRTSTPLRTSPPLARDRPRPLRRTGVAGSRTFRRECSSETTGSSYSGRAPRRCSSGGRSGSCLRSG